MAGLLGSGRGLPRADPDYQWAGDVSGGSMGDTHVELRGIGRGPGRGVLPRGTADRRDIGVLDRKSPAPRAARGRTYEMRCEKPCLPESKNRAPACDVTMARATPRRATSVVRAKPQARRKQDHPHHLAHYLAPPPALGRVSVSGLCAPHLGVSHGQSTT